MCGIGAIIHKTMNINNLLYEIIFNLQHRGQECCGFISYDKNTNTTYEIKEFGLVDKNINNISKIKGNIGIGHVRYPTQGEITKNEIQPLYSDIFDGISLVHNGNLTNCNELNDFCMTNKIELITTSDSEIILKIFIYFLKKHISNLYELTPEIIKNIIKNIYDTCKGSYSIIILINNYGFIIFRDVYGIKPLVYHVENDNIVIASETCSLPSINYKNVNNGDVVIIQDFNIIIQNIYNYPLTPCLFEYIYFAQPESYINDILVYEYRERIAKELVKIIKNKGYNLENIDCIIPVPQTGIITANRIAEHLKLPLKSAIIKNRYTHRTFINKNNEEIVKNIKKIKIINKLVNNKNIIVIDDSIVRGNTCKYIINELKKNNVKNIIFISCCPPIKYPNKYGINIPTFNELIAYKNCELAIQEKLELDGLHFLELESLCKIITELNPKIKNYETSVFTGDYIA